MRQEAIKLRDIIIRNASLKKFQPGFPNWAEQNPPIDPKTGKPVRPALPAEPGMSKTTTWCNEMANAVLVDAGFDTKPILHPKGIGWTTATALYDNAAACAALAGHAGGCGVYEVTARQAQEWANRGIPVLAAAKNPNPAQASHVGIVCPSDDPGDAKGDPWIGEAGAPVTQGFRDAHDSFIKWGLSTPRYFLLPIQQA
jgi:hypothetical protein